MTRRTRVHVRWEGAGSRVHPSATSLAASAAVAEHCPAQLIMTLHVMMSLVHHGGSHGRPPGRCRASVSCLRDATSLLAAPRARVATACVCCRSGEAFKSMLACGQRCKAGGWFVGGPARGGVPSTMLPAVVTSQVGFDVRALLLLEVDAREATVSTCSPPARASVPLALRLVKLAAGRLLRAVIPCVHAVSKRRGASGNSYTSRCTRDRHLRMSTHGYYCGGLVGFRGRVRGGREGGVFTIRTSWG